VPELRKDPIVGRWVIISTDRAKRPADFVREPVTKKGGFCPFCAGLPSKRRRARWFGVDGSSSAQQVSGAGN
jgi:galactose-1-phosphate uridylyltransferase